MNTLNCIEKNFTFTFEGLEFHIDLKQGNLQDVWDAVQCNFRELDFNFYWEEAYEKPSARLYELKFDGATETWMTDTSKSHILTIDNIIGTEVDYFGEEVEQTE